MFVAIGNSISSRRSISQFSRFVAIVVSCSKTNYLNIALLYVAQICRKRPPLVSSEESPPRQGKQQQQIQ